MGVAEAPRGSEKSQLEVSPAKRRVKLSPSPNPSRSTSELVLLMAKLRSELLFEVEVEVAMEAPVGVASEPEAAGVVEEGGG